MVVSKNWIGEIRVCSNLCLNWSTRKKLFNSSVFAWRFIASWGKGHDEVIYKDALVVELTRAGIPVSREQNHEITYKGVILPHYYLCWFCCVGEDSSWSQSCRKIDRLAHQTSVELSGCLETPRRVVGQFRRWFLGVETSHFVDTNDTERDTNYTNYH